MMGSTCRSVSLPKRNPLSTVSKALLRSTNSWRAPASRNLVCPIALLVGVARWLACKLRAIRQWCAILASASCVDLKGMYAQRGHVRMHGRVCLSPICPNNPIKLFPMGSWSASGLSIEGWWGVFPGFGIRVSHPWRQELGITGVGRIHHFCNHL